ncbi:MAG TPA: hypothetical protein VG838_14910 [Opitutaceae bacterium]|nr:hypothetical protein [Opitutaceae bacterium]
MARHKLRNFHGAIRSRWFAKQEFRIQVSRSPMNGFPTPEDPAARVKGGRQGSASRSEGSKRKGGIFVRAGILPVPVPTKQYGAS